MIDLLREEQIPNSEDCRKRLCDASVESLIRLSEQNKDTAYVIKDDHVPGLELHLFASQISPTFVYNQFFTFPSEGTDKPKSIPIRFNIGGCKKTSASVARAAAKSMNRVLDFLEKQTDQDFVALGRAFARESAVVARTENRCLLREERASEFEESVNRRVNRQLEIAQKLVEAAKKREQQARESIDRYCELAVLGGGGTKATRARISVENFVPSLVPPPLSSYLPLSKASEVYEEMSGIYFAKRGDVLAYIGKSVSLGKRWRSHHKIESTDMIAVVPLPPEALEMAEHNMIHRCLPLLNKEWSFEYTSGSQLATPAGSMHGSYFCVAEDGERFEAPIPAFALSMPRTLH